MSAILTIPTLLGPGGLNINNPTDETGQHWILVCPMAISGVDRANRIGLMWELYSKPAVGQFALVGEPTVFDVPLSGGEWNHGSPGIEDGVFLDLPVHVGPIAQYRMVLTPDGGDPVQVDFARDVGGIRNQVLFVGPRPSPLPTPPPPSQPAAEVRAKFGWKTPA